MFFRYHTKSPKKSAKRALAVLAIAGFVHAAPAAFDGLPAWALETPQAIVESWIANSAGSDVLKVSHGLIDHNAATGVTTVRDLKITFDMELKAPSNGAGQSSILYEFIFPTIAFHDLKDDGTHYAAKLIAADKVNLVFDINQPGSGSSKSTGSYDGLSLMMPRWPKLPEFPEVEDNAEKPFSQFYPLVAGLFDFYAERMEVGQMSLQTKDAATGLGMDVRYGSILIENVVAGDIERMRMNGVEMDIATKDSMTVNVAMGPFTVDQYNYGSLARLFEPGKPPATDPERPYKPLIGSIVMDGLTASSGDLFDVKMDTFTVKDVGMREPSVDVFSELDALYISSKAGTQEPDPKQMIALLAGIYGSLSLGEVSLSNINVNSKKENVQASLGSYLLSDLSANGLGELSVRGISFTDNKSNSFSLGEYSYGDIGFPALVDLMSPQLLRMDGGEPSVEAIMKVIPTIGYIRILDVVANLEKEGNFALKEGSIEMSKHIGPIPTVVSTTIDGLKMPVDKLEPEQRQVFEGLGYEMLEGSFITAMRYDERNSELNVENVTELNQGGKFNLYASVGGIPRSIFENPQTAQGAVLGATINGASVSFNDTSLIERVMKMVAQQQGSDVETLKVQAVGLIPLMMSALNNPEFATEVAEAVKTFLNRDADGRGAIVAVAQPDAPIGLLQIMGAMQSDPGSVVKMLNLSVSAE